MTVNSKELQLIATGPSPSGETGTCNTYRLVTNDTAAAVETDGYFDGVFDDGLNEGDFILATLDKDGTPLGKIYFVTAGGADVAVRGLGAAIAALTDNSAGTADDTLEALSDGTTYANDVAAIRNNFADLAAKINEIIAAITV